MELFMQFDFDIIQLRAEKKDKDSIYRINLNGDLTFNTHQEFSSAISDLIKNGTRKLLIDFQDLAIIDTVGIGLFVKFKKELDKENGELAITRCADHILSILDPLNFSKFIKIFENPDDAMNYLNSMN